MNQLYQYYIDDIQAALISPATADRVLLQESAALYSEACAEINDRLRKVAFLLGKDLRSEAIQLAEEEPHVLDIFAMLDFPELPVWRSMLEQWGMTPPPVLLREIAEQIDTAYATQQPIERLLKSHRLLALGKAPLATRIQVLRKLVDAESESAVWETDLAEIEEARSKQISSEAKKAAKANDLPCLNKLVEEVQSQDWTISLSAVLQREVEQLHEKVAVSFAQKELHDVELALSNAHGEMDIDRGFALEERWDSLVKTAGSEVESPLLERAQPALDWVRSSRDKLERTQEFELAIIALEQALDDQLPISELKQLYYNAKLFDEPIPEVVQHRYDECHATEELSSVRNFRLLLSGVVGSILLVAALLSYYFSVQVHNQRIADNAKVLVAFNDVGNFEEAKSHYESLLLEDEVVAKSLPVQEAYAKTVESIDEEVSRRESFAIEISKIEAWVPGEQLNSEALKSVRSLAVSASELDRVAKFEDQFQRWKRKVVEEQTEGLVTSFKTLREELLRLEKEVATTSGDKSNLMTSLANLERSVNQAVKSFPKASSKVAVSSSVLIEKTHDIMASIRLQEKRVSSVQQVTKAIGNTEEFCEALEAYYLCQPNPPGAEASAVLSESILWEGLLKWNTMYQRYFSSSSNISSDLARKIIEEGEKLLQDYKEIPISQDFEKRLPYLRSIANRKPTQTSWLLKDIEKRFRADPLVANLYMVRAGDDRYYSRQMPEENGKLLRLKYVCDLQLNERITTLQRGNCNFIDRSPQSVFADKAMRALKRLPERRWEQVLVPMIEALLRDKELDPVVKILLLQAVLKPAMEGSSVLEEAYKQIYSEIADAGVGGSVWVDPEDPVLKKERTRAEIILNGLVKVSDQRRAALYGKARSLLGPLDTRYSWVGWLRNDEQGRWAMAGPSNQKSAGKLVVIVQRGGSQAAQIIPVGSISGNSAKISTTDSASLADGRAVFLQESTKTSYSVGAEVMPVNRLVKLPR